MKRTWYYLFVPKSASSDLGIFLKEYMKIVKQEILDNEYDASNELYLMTAYDNGQFKIETITSEQAAQWQAEHRF